jgi:hypothetical protein
MHTTYLSYAASKEKNEELLSVGFSNGIVIRRVQSARAAKPWGTSKQSLSLACFSFYLPNNQQASGKQTPQINPDLRPQLSFQ